MKKIFIICFIGFSLLFCEEKNVNNTLENFGLEAVQCASYYSIAAECLQYSGYLELAKNLNQKSEKSLFDAVRYYKASYKQRSDQMCQQLAISSFENNIASMMTKIEDDCANLSMLSDKYLENCKNTLFRADVILSK